jgi:hypothetical protein
LGELALFNILVSAAPRNTGYNETARPDTYLSSKWSEVLNYTVTPEPNTRTSLKRVFAGPFAGQNQLLN